MKYLHYEFEGKKGKKIKVLFDQPCKVLFMDKLMYIQYSNGKSFTAVGGFKEKSPAIFEIPRDGHCHIVVELGSYYKPANIKASVVLV